MIYFFYLLSFIFVLILSEITAKKERIKKYKKSKENFSDFQPFVSKNGHTHQSVSDTMRKVNKKVINPFKKCGDVFITSNFNWPSYFETANKKMTTLAANQVFF